MEKLRKFRRETAPATTSRKYCQECNRQFIGAAEICPIDNFALTPAKLTTEESMIVPGYRLAHELGLGGSARIVMAERLSDGLPVAVKIMHRWLLEEPVMMARFQAEAAIAGALASCHIVSVVESGTLSDGRPFIVMEYVDGTDMRQAIGNPGHNARTLLPLFIQLTTGLAHCHERGIVHKDVKPSNVLLTELGGKQIVKIADFGIAQRTVSNNIIQMSRPGETSGSPLYMSPEQCMGRRIDHRTDIYSTGCLMYELLTGQPPFLAGDSRSLMKKHCVEIPELPLADTAMNDCGLSYVLARCLAKDPDHRYQHIDTLQKDLWSCLMGLPPTKAIQTPISLVA